MNQKIQRNIDLVIKKLTTLEEIDGSDYARLTQAEKEAIGYFARDFGMKHWDWPQGVGLYGLQVMNDSKETYIKEWANEEIAKGLPLPNINTVRPLFTLMDFDEYEDLCIQWANHIMIDFDRTKEGGLQHNTTGKTKDTIAYKNQQIWADTIYMTVLFLGKMGIKYHNQKWIDEAIYQVMLHLKYLLDRKTGLYYHGWDFSEQSDFGGHFWCRGNSWLTMGLPLFIDLMGDQLPSYVKKSFVHAYTNQVESLFKYRDKDELLWHTLLDDSTSYIEVSGSAGIVAGVYMGIKTGVLPREPYKKLCDDSVGQLLKQIDSEGTVQGVSAGTVIGHTKDHYKNIIVKPMAYGQAMMLCALVESLQI